MSLLIPFTVLIERRAKLLRAAVATLTSFSLFVSGFGLRMAHAAPRDDDKRAHKVARDLDDHVRGFNGKRNRWARDIGGVRHVQAVVVTDGSDPSMKGLRHYVRSLGGTVHAVQPTLHTMTVQVRASDIDRIAERDDVLSVSPNRQTQRTFSTIEAVTGAVAGSVRTYNGKSNYAGIDGSGVGIAVLDSGVMKTHYAFVGPSGVRVKRNVSMLNTTAANWAGNAASESSLQPGSLALTTYEALVANDATCVPWP